MRENFAVISGAGNGIGKATLQRFLERDYFCIAIDKNKEDLSRLEKEHRKTHGNRLTCFELDLMAIEKAPEEISSLSKSCQGILSLVNLVGGSFLELRDSHKDSNTDWNLYENLYRFNLKPTVLLTNALLPLMKKRKGGYIVNISSISARSTVLRHIGAEYSAAKSAVITYSRKIAAKYAKDNILVNTVCPRIIRTNRISELWKTRSEDINNGVLQNIPLGRLGEPDEIAKAIVFLGSKENTYITGAILDVNGGIFMP